MAVLPNAEGRHFFELFHPDYRREIRKLVYFCRTRVSHIVDLENADIIIESLKFKSNQEKAVKLLEKETRGYSNNVRETQVKWSKE